MQEINQRERDEQRAEEIYALRQSIKNELDAMDDDADNETLEKAMQYFCSLWDIREGMKHAIMLTADDQCDNHAVEQDIADWKKLLQILKGVQ